MAGDFLIFKKIRLFNFNQMFLIYIRFFIFLTLFHFLKISKYKINQNTLQTKKSYPSPITNQNNNAYTDELSCILAPAWLELYPKQNTYFFIRNWFIRNECWAGQKHKKLWYIVQEGASCKMKLVYLLKTHSLALSSHSDDMVRVCAKSCSI